MTVLQKLWLDNHKKTSKTVLSGRFGVTSFGSWVFICGNINKVSPDFKCGGSESAYLLLYPLYFSTFDKWNNFTVLLIFFRWKVKTLLEMLKCILCRKPPNHRLKHIKFVRSLFEFPPFATCKGENKTETHHSPLCDTRIRTLRKTWPEVGADVFWMLFEWWPADRAERFGAERLDSL